ncbi:MAG: type II toxin-antitoxin system RelE/ParE family toxin [Parcubacteria group bacterium]
MIYNNSEEYKVKFYKNTKTGRSLVLDYIERLNNKEQAKILKYIEFLRINKGYLEEPYSKHIKGKIRELRVDFSRNRHRIFYFIFIKKTIILLHAFLKKTAKMPTFEIKRAEENYNNVLKNSRIYE